MVRAINNNIPCQSKFRLLSKLSLRKSPLLSFFRVAYFSSKKEATDLFCSPDVASFNIRRYK